MTQATDLTLAKDFVDRRSATQLDESSGVDRRQFANNHEELSPPARELAKAIDEYKLDHRRRFINFEEIYEVITSLGYHK